jgi:hypothetical protein
MSSAAGRLVPIPPPSPGGGSAYGDEDDECTDELIDRILENYQFHFKPETRVKIKQRCVRACADGAVWRWWSATAAARTTGASCCGRLPALLLQSGCMSLPLYQDKQQRIADPCRRRHANPFPPGGATSRCAPATPSPGTATRGGASRCGCRDDGSGRSALHHRRSSALQHTTTPPPPHERTPGQARRPGGPLQPLHAQHPPRPRPQHRRGLLQQDPHEHLPAAVRAVVQLGPRGA